MHKLNMSLSLCAFFLPGLPLLFKFSCCLLMSPGLHLWCFWLTPCLLSPSPLSYTPEIVMICLSSACKHAVSLSRSTSEGIWLGHAWCIHLRASQGIHIHTYMPPALCLGQGHRKMFLVRGALLQARLLAVCLLYFWIADIKDMGAKIKGGSSPWPLEPPTSYTYVGTLHQSISWPYMILAMFYLVCPRLYCHAPL